MRNYKYILDKSSKKTQCPNCRKRRFVKYINSENGEYLPEKYGRCDREVNCSYYLDPYTGGYAKGETLESNWPYPEYPSPQTVFIPNEILKKTLSGYDQNTFIQTLLTTVAYPFEVDEVERAISLYRLGTVQNGYRKGAITFPFIDIDGNIRAMQVKQFDNNNHTTGTDFINAIIKKHYIRNQISMPRWLKAYEKNETKVSCLFGEHLLRTGPNRTIALVEAPKTAIYGSLYFKDLLWLAVYNLSSFNYKKCKVLKGRKVILFPDISAFDNWKKKAEEMEDIDFSVSDLLENSGLVSGSDLADYLITKDWRLFQRNDGDGLTTSEKLNILEHEWQKIHTSTIKFRPLLVNDIKIQNVFEFVNYQFELIETNIDNVEYIPFLERLHEILFELSNPPQV